MVDEGFVNAEEVRRMVIPTVGRCKADFMAPFAGSGRFAGLSIEHMEIFQGEDRIWAEFEANRDASAFGKRWAAFSRASVFPTLAAALDGGRGDPRSADFVDRLEAGLGKRLAISTEKMLIPLAQILLAKENVSRPASQ